MSTAWEPVLEFWFGTLDQKGRADADHVGRWWKKDDDFDAEIRQRFSALHEAIVARRHEEFRAEPRGRLAYVIVLDQFSRNMFRGSERMFEGDEQALQAADEGVRAGHDRALAFDERTFLYMPFMHSEKLEDQDRCVALFQALRSEVDDTLRERVDSSIEFAGRHRDIVQTFGRFPHRNAVLERTSTAHELEFLLKPGSSF